MTPLELYKELYEEFIKGSPTSPLNLKCNTQEDVIVEAMEQWAKISKLNDLGRNSKYHI